MADDTHIEAPSKLQEATFKAEHVVTKTLKGAAIGGAIGGAALMGAALFAGPIGWATALGTYFIGAGATVGLATLGAGAGIGGVIAAATSQPTKEWEKKLEKDEATNARADIRERKLKALEQRQRAQAIELARQEEAMGIRPNVPYARENEGRSV